MKFFTLAKQKSYPATTLAPQLPCPRTLALCSLRDARGCLTYEQALRFCVLPLGLLHRRSHQVITVAIPTTSTATSPEEYRFLFGREVKLVTIDGGVLLEAIFRAYRGDEATFAEEAEHFLLKAAQENTTSPGVEKFMRTLIEYAAARDATDIHFVPEAAGSRIMLRIQGELFVQHDSALTPPVHLTLVRWLKVQCRLSSVKTDVPLDGAFEVILPHRRQPIRLSTMPTGWGEKVVLRLLHNRDVHSLEGLGLSEVVRNHLTSSLDLSEGLILVGGPTGSGKTTTLYASLKYLVTRGKSVITIEDPVEAVITGVAQTSVNSHGMSLATYLRGALRQDPDAFMLGEVRDAECAQMLLDASLTGHLTLASIHGSSVSGVLNRLFRFGISYEEILRSTRFIVVQSLEPTLCLRCRTIDLLASNSQGQELYRKVGCITCDYTGYGGQIPITESLIVTNSTIKTLLTHGTSPDALLTLHPSLYQSRLYVLQNALATGLLAWEDYLRWSLTSNSSLQNL
jgi:type II secretory ATPase GspE/PulE/Tfp pilus assembly ATPase PilB-like protein